MSETKKCDLLARLLSFLSQFAIEDLQLQPLKNAIKLSYTRRISHYQSAVKCCIQILFFKEYLFT